MSRRSVGKHVLGKVQVVHRSLTSRRKKALLKYRSEREVESSKASRGRRRYR